MFYKIENGKFVGFYEEIQEDGTFVEISIEDWQEVLNKQSEGEVIFYNATSKKLETIKLGQFETLKGTSIETDILALKKSIISELAKLKYEYDVKPFEFEVEGVTYLQNNRSIDQSNLTRITVMCQAMKKTTFENWKFYTKDNSEKYVNISLQDMMKMASIMQAQTTKSMVTETLLSHNLENLTDEDLKNYNTVEEYKKAYNNVS